MTSGQLGLGSWEGSGITWQTPHFAGSGIALAQASRLDAPRLIKKLDLCFANSLSEWQALQWVRRVLLLPFEAAR